MTPGDPHQRSASSSESPSRRRFFTALFWGTACGLAGVFTAAVVAVLRPPARQSDTAREAEDLGALSDYPDGMPVARMMPPAPAGVDPYAQSQRVYVIRKGGTAVVLSSVCTHLECQVEWEGMDQRFHCPCHGGTFDLSGSAVGGPPRDPLLRLPANVVAGRLQVRPV